MWKKIRDAFTPKQTTRAFRLRAKVMMYGAGQYLKAGEDGVLRVPILSSGADNVKEVLCIYPDTEEIVPIESLPEDIQTMLKKD